MTEIDVWIPLQPDASLSPNARGHWARRHRATQEARGAARLATVDALSRLGVAWPKEGGVEVHAGILWGKGRKMVDGDNSVAVLKAYLDGAADALGVDDRTFLVPTVTQARAPEGPGVVLHMRAIPTP